MIYDIIAPFYDKVNGDIDYSAWADFIETIISREYNGQPELVLDLGCGTGRMTLELAKRGYDMTGVDVSPEMLDIARNNGEKAGFSDKILWLCQDMCEFELYGTVDITVSCLDCINHILKPAELAECFKLVHNYLIPDGLFIFDINGKNKFETVYADNSYVMENETSLCTWQNFYNSKNGICDFYITVFEEDGFGKYNRFDDVQSEKMYTVRSIKQSLSKCGFEFIGAYRDFDFSDASDKDDRIYIVARCKK
jgi:SAM-dependent methyltransferase